MMEIFLLFIVIATLFLLSRKVFVLEKYKNEAPSSFLLGQIPFGLKLSNMLDSTLEEIALKGDIVHFQILHKHYFIVNEPSQIHQVLTDSDFDSDVESSKSYQSLVGGANLFSIPLGKQWTNHRRLLFPVFNNAGNLKDVSPIFAFHSLHFCDKLRELVQDEENRPIEFSQLIRNLTVQMFVHYAFGVDIDQSENITDDQQRFIKAIDTMILFAGNNRLSFISSLYNKMHPRAFSNFKSARKMIKQRIAEIVNKASMRNFEEGKLVQQLHKAEETESSFKFSKEDIESSTLLFFFVGYDTTNSSILWVELSTVLTNQSLYQLSTHPEIQQKLRNEILQVMEARKEVTYEDIEKMKYLDCVVKEVLRVYPTASAAQRTANVTKKIGETLIPKGSSVVVNFHGVHRSEKYWENAKQFIPERWLSIEKGTVREKYYPFGGGYRKCIGAKVSDLEMKIVIATLILQFSFECANKGKLETFRNVVVRPKYLYLKLTPI